MGFAVTCGRPPASRRCSGAPSACAISATMSAACSARSAGAGSSPWNSPRSATRRRLQRGRRSAGRPSKKAVDEGYTIVWVDESGFYLLPMAVRTWAPRGQTPVLRVQLTHDHLSVISGITLDGRLFLQMQEQAYTAETVVGFLRVLLRKIRGKVLVIWDGSPIHKGQPIKDFLAAGAA
jgi:hypothetical protein